MTELEEIARDAILQYYPGADLYAIILKAIERVQKESLAAAVAILEYQKSLAMPQEQQYWQISINQIRDNIRLAPVEQVSDKTLRDLAQDFYQWAPGEYLDYREEIKDAFIAGYRAAEKKARGE